MDGKGDWIWKAADAAERRMQREREAGTRKADDPIVCASGISPSGPIHLGNLREVMTTHLVAEELKRRGHRVSHIHSWDDYDRFRKVPAGVPDEFAQHLGKPISQVPDPWGEHDSYATRWIVQFRTAVARLGVQCDWIRQSEQYPAGTYRQQIRVALERRLDIFDILSKYQTEKLQEVPLEERRAAYWPLAVYCPETGKDTTTVLGFDADTGTVRYHSQGVGERSFNLDTDPTLHCKLVWKVDWPMRWAHESVVFEPGGEDHASPGSSFTVGKELCPSIYGWKAPEFVQYGFVGMAGRTKMSSSTGGAATPEFALKFIEPAILRWLYLRKAPRKKFSIDFGSEIWRTYDEFDAFVARRGTPKERPGDALEFARCTQTSAAKVPTPDLPVGFRIIASAADVTNGHVGQTLRIVADHLDDPPPADALADLVQPRLDCALGWAVHCQPEDERLSVRQSPAADAWEGLDPDVQRAVRLLAEGLSTHWNLNKLTTLVYGVAKQVRGLPMDAKPDPELRAFQRQVFIGIYGLLLGTDTGPRLPTLLLSLGQERVRALLLPTG